MQVWQLFIILRQPVTILATIFSNPIKLTNESSQDSSVGNKLDWYHKGDGFESRQGIEIYLPF